MYELKKRKEHLKEIRDIGIEILRSRHSISGIVVSWEEEQEDGSASTVTRYHGGLNRCSGLSRETLRRLDSRRCETDFIEQDQDDLCV